MLSVGQEERQPACLLLGRDPVRPGIAPENLSDYTEI